MVRVIAPDAGVNLRHTPVTVTFANSSGTVAVATNTGRVLISACAAHVTDSVVEDGAVTSIELGTTTDPDGLIVQTNPSLLLSGTFWVDATPVAALAQMAAAQIDVMTAESLILTITGGTDLDSGTIVFDFWYMSMTTGALLVPA